MGALSLGRVALLCATLGLLVLPWHGLEDGVADLSAWPGGAPAPLVALLLTGARWWLWPVALLLALAALPWRAAEAQIGSARYSAIVMEARTGTVLIDAGADEPRYPASLTKMMTLYMVFEALRDGRTQLNSRVVMSEEAASRPPSKLGIPPGGGLTVEQAILALVTKSANDVAAAVGEHLGGSRVC